MIAGSEVSVFESVLSIGLARASSSESTTTYFPNDVEINDVSESEPVIPKEQRERIHSLTPDETDQFDCTLSGLVTYQKSVATVSTALSMVMRTPITDLTKEQYETIEAVYRFTNGALMEYRYLLQYGDVSEALQKEIRDESSYLSQQLKTVFKKNHEADSSSHGSGSELVTDV